jgi:hypothetical protein
MINTSRVAMAISLGMVWRRNDEFWAECEELDRDVRPKNSLRR